MNIAILTGRLVKDAETKTLSTGSTITSFTIAVDRRFKDPNGQRQTDFINCVAWRQTASFIGSYFHKGNRIAITGSIQTRTYDDNQGQKRYVTEVVVDEAEFVESANSGSRENQAAPAPVQTAPVSAPEAPKTPIASPVDAGIYEEKDDGSGELPFDV